MIIQHCDPRLKELNRRIQGAFFQSSLPQDDIKACRFRAMGMPSSLTELSPAHHELTLALTDCLSFAEDHGLSDVAGWCIAAGQDPSILEKSGESMDGPVIEFLQTHAPPPATVLDVGSGSGRFPGSVKRQNFSGGVLPG